MVWATDDVDLGQAGEHGHRQVVAMKNHLGKGRIYIFLKLTLKGVSLQMAPPSTQFLKQQLKSYLLLERWLSIH